MTFHRPRLLTLLPLGLGLLSAACGSTGSGTPDQGPPEFVIGTRVWDDTTTTSYFHLVPSLEEGTIVDSRRALEIPGAAKLYTVEGLGWIAVGGGDDPTITHYTVEDGVLTEQEAITLQPSGVTGLWDTLYVVSATKIYYPDRDGHQLIIINPTDMAVEGTIALPQTAREGYLPLYSYGAIRRGDALLFSVAWVDWDVNDDLVGETGLVVLDTTTDTVTRFDVDTRCGGITQPVTVASGDTYFASSALAAAAHRLERLPTEPCALRILADADAFDSTYDTKLDDVVGSDIVGEPIPAGGNEIFLRVFDTATGTVGENDATWELTSQTVWQWWRWDVTTGEATRVTTLEPSTADVLWFQVGGRVYGSETLADYSETTLIELTAADGPRRGLTAPGFLHGVGSIH